MQHSSRRPAPVSRNLAADPFYVAKSGIHSKSYQQMDRMPVDRSAMRHGRQAANGKPVAFKSHNTKMHMMQPYHLTTSPPEPQRAVHSYNRTAELLRDADTIPLFVYRVPKPAYRLHPNAVKFDENAIYKALMEYEDRLAALEEPRNASASSVRARLQPPVGVAHSEHAHVSGDRLFDEDAEMVGSRPHAQHLAMPRHKEMPSTAAAPLPATSAAHRTAPPPPPQSFGPNKVANSQLDATEPHYRPQHSHGQYGPHSNHTNMPIMLKFTINDAIIRPPSAEGQSASPAIHHRRKQYSQHSRKPNAPAPSRPNEVDAAHKGPDSEHFARRPAIVVEPEPKPQIAAHLPVRLQTLHQMQQSASDQSANQRLAPLASFISSQVYHPSSVEPIVLSTQMTVGAGNGRGMTGPQTFDQVPANTAKRSEKQLRRASARRGHPSADNASTVPPTKPTDSLPEFSDSYTKRRTQGAHISAESALTTPIPAKLKNTRGQLNESDHGPMTGGQWPKQRQTKQQQQQPRSASKAAADVNEPTHDADATYFQ